MLRCGGVIFLTQVDAQAPASDLGKAWRSQELDSSPSSGLPYSDLEQSPSVHTGVGQAILYVE